MENIIYVLNILKKYTDEEHLLSSNKIKDLIKKEYNEKVDSRTIRRYIGVLRDKLNYDIVTTNFGNFIRRDPDKDFELGELSAIINTFEYSNFIRDDMANEILNKCLNNMNVYEKEKYKNYKVSMKDTKTDNKEIIKNIEDINDAIYRKRKIEFDYYKYDLEGSSLKEKKEGQVITSPYRLIYALQKFYLVCKNENRTKLYTYRLDKIKNLVITKHKREDKFTESEIDFFVESNVNMLSGDLEKVKIECNINMLDNVVELYGKNIKLERLNNNKFKASFYTTIKGFRYWCLRNIENVKVLKPTYLKEDIKKVLKENI